jgi:flagellar biosynthesis/type III secretory pathway chaperone
VLFARKPAGGKGQTAVADRDRLMQRREALFQQLIDAERDRRAQPASAGQQNDAAKNRRNEIVSKLESVYRDLAALDEPRAT